MRSGGAAYTEMDGGREAEVWRMERARGRVCVNKLEESKERERRRERKKRRKVGSLNSS